MNAQEQLAKLESASNLDLSAVKEEVITIVRETQEKVASLKEAASIQQGAGYSGHDAKNLATNLEKEATDRIRGIVFGSFLQEFGKPSPSASNLFFGLEGWK